MHLEDTLLSQQTWNKIISIIFEVISKTDIFPNKEKKPSRIDKLLAKQVFGVGTGIKVGVFIQPKQVE